MSAEANKTASRRIFEEGFGMGKTDVVDEFVAADAALVGPAQAPDQQGAAGLKAAIAMYRGAFPDLTAKVEEQVAEGDIVVSRWSSTGTNSGSLQGMPPTGKKVVVVGVNIDKYKDGKVVSSWGVFDQFGMLVQLGVVPPPGG